MISRTAARRHSPTWRGKLIAEKVPHGNATTRGTSSGASNSGLDRNARSRMHGASSLMNVMKRVCVCVRSRVLLTETVYATVANELRNSRPRAKRRASEIHRLRLNWPRRRWFIMTRGESRVMSCINPPRWRKIIHSGSMILRIIWRRSPRCLSFEPKSRLIDDTAYRFDAHPPTNDFPSPRPPPVLLPHTLCTNLLFYLTENKICHAPCCSRQIYIIPQWFVC